MNPYLLDPWKPYHVIEWGDQKFEVFSRIESENDFVNHMRFMLVSPDGKRCVLSIASSKKAVDDYDAYFGAGEHEKVVREAVLAEAVEEIKAVYGSSAPKFVQPDVKLMPIKADSLIYTGVDFAKVEAEMMAHVFHLQPPSGKPVYGPSLIAGSALKIHKAQKVMEDAFKKLASGFVKADPTWDSLAGASKEEIFKVLYGGEPTQQLTPKGHATLKRFGVALAG